MTPDLRAARPVPRAAVAALAATLLWALLVAAPAAGSSLGWEVAEEDAVRVVADAGAREEVPVTIRVRPCRRDPKVLEITGPGLSTRTVTRSCAVRVRLPREAVYRATLRRPTSSTGRVARARIKARHLRIVALGDSFSSGEGAPDRAGLYVPVRDAAGTVTGVAPLRRARWSDPGCHRSRRAAPARAAESLTDGRTLITLVLLACTGARVEAGLLGPGGGLRSELLLSGAPQVRPDAGAQVARARRALRSARADAVLVGIGGNDIGFADIVRTCATAEACQRLLAPALPERIAGLDAALERLAPALVALAPPRRIVVTAYPDVVSGPSAACPASGIGIDAGEAAWAASALDELNRELRVAAARSGWRWAGRVATALRGRGVCAGPAARVLDVVDSVTRQGTETGALHPDALGQRAMGDALAITLRSVVRRG